MVPHVRNVSATLLLVLAACGSSESQSRDLGSTLLHVTSVDTVISTESGLIGYVADLAIEPGGALFVADSQTEHVLRLNRGSSAIQMLGGPGQGPGEFKDLGALRVVGDELLALDAGNGRLQRLTLNGEYVGQAPVNPLVRAGAADLKADGGMLLSSMGSDTALVREFDADAQFVRKVGDPVVITSMFWDVADIKARIADGEVPDELRNVNFVVGDEEGGLWVALRAVGGVRRYGRDGALMWTTIIDAPELSGAKEQFFSRNAAIESPMSFVTLSYFADGQAVGDRLWLLLETELGSDGVVLVVGPDGRTERRIEVRGGGGAHKLLVDTQRGELWLATKDDAQLLRAKLDS